MLMEQLYSQLSKDQLIARLIATEREKEHLCELITIKEQKIKELSKSVSQSSEESSFFDTTFSANQLQIVDKVYEITKVSNAAWPSVRSREPITGVKTFKLTMPCYGWIGLGTKNMSSIGFPGYTPEGWMINTNGSVHHNSVSITVNNLIKFEKKTVIVKVDVPKSEITIDGVTQKLGDNCPKQAYFVISMNTPAEKIIFQALE